MPLVWLADPAVDSYGLLTLALAMIIAMQAVGVGFIIGVIQDSCETGLNSSSDALFTAIAEFYDRRKQGKDFSF